MLEKIRSKIRSRIKKRFEEGVKETIDQYNHIHCRICLEHRLKYGERRVYAWIIGGFFFILALLVNFAFIFIVLGVMFYIFYTLDPRPCKGKGGPDIGQMDSKIDQLDLKTSNAIVNINEAIINNLLEDGATYKGLSTDRLEQARRYQIAKYEEAITTAAKTRALVDESILCMFLFDRYEAGAYEES